MKTSDVRAMTVDQIDDEILKLKKERFNLRFQRATGQLENTSRVRVIRRDIARLKTIATEKRDGVDRAQGAVRAEKQPKPQSKPQRVADASPSPAKPKAKTKTKSQSKSSAKPKRQSARSTKSKAKSK